jgi:hypothetical protein
MSLKNIIQSLPAAEPKPVKPGPTVAATVPALVEDKDRDFGPCMSACKPKERAFVIAVVGGQSFANSARLAGYGEADSTPATLASIGHRIKSYPRVSAALVEEARLALRSLAPKAVGTVMEILDSFAPRERLKAAEMILARTDPTVTKIEGKIEHEIVDRETETLKHLAHMISLGVGEDALVREFGPLGLQYYRDKLEALEAKSKIVDAEYEVVGGNNASE